MAALEPPFTSNETIFVQAPSQPQTQPQTQAPSQSQSQTPPSPGLKLNLPAIYTAQDKGILRVTSDLQAYLTNELDVSRLNKIHKHLWAAGLERPARPLHTQLALGRSLIISEQADLHLLWKGTRMHIKPLPEYLLCHGIWQQNICKERDLFEKASGFLLSYVWLVQSKSDLHIAHEHALVSAAVTWETWTRFVDIVVQHLDHAGKRNINIRYRRGELRLDRINLAYRFCSQTRSLTNILRGYRYGYQDYGSFIDRNLGWLTTATVYVAVVLTAMQVGLATDLLKDDRSFQNASYGFTVFSIVAPLIVVAAVMLFTLVLVVFNWDFSLKSKKQYDDQALDSWKH